MDGHANHSHSHGAISGNFIGHIGPGSFFLLLGIFHYLQAIESKFSATVFRTTAAYLAKFMAIILASALGLSVEYGLMNSHSGPWYSTPHLWMFFSVLFGGTLVLFALFNVLREPSWSVALPISLFTVGISFFTHDDSTPLNLLVHQVISVATTLLSVSIFVELSVSYQTKFSWNEHQQADSSCNCCIWKVSLKDLNPTYVNPQLYNTIYPSLTGYSAMFLGIFWILVAFTIYTWQLYLFPLEAKNIVFALLVLTFIITSCIAAFLSLVVRMTEYLSNKCGTCANRHNNNNTSNEVEFDRLNLNNDEDNIHNSSM